MPGTPEHSDMPAGTLAPPGTYVVSHRSPWHAEPHKAYWNRMNPAEVQSLCEPALQSGTFTC
jgi:hypothetical protein